jgi:LacI family transcriptional regulator
MRRPDRVTIIEVARSAGVSTATAGRVLGGYGYASSDIKDRVRQAAEALGYRPNRLAKSLITGKTQTIGVVAGDIESPFYASVLRGIGDVARAEGFGIIVTNSDEEPALEREAVQLLLEKQVDGLIVAPCDPAASKHLHDAVAANFPVVQIDRAARGLAADSVSVDNLGAARHCVEVLFAAGHRRIGIIAELERPFDDLAAFLDQAPRLISDAKTLMPSWQRLLGYLEAHQDAGVAVDLRLVRRSGGYSAAAAKEATLALLQGEDRPTALFTADGLMSLGAIDAVTGLGLRIPGELSLVCFDDLDWMKFMRPGISAVAQPVYDVGRAAAECILARINGARTPLRHVVLATTLNQRGSIAPPAGR